MLAPTPRITEPAWRGLGHGSWPAGNAIVRPSATPTAPTRRPSATLWLVVTQDFGCQNCYSRKVVLMHTHPGVIEGCEFTERNQRGEKPEETTKL